MASVALKNVAAGPLESGLELTIKDREFVVLAGPATSTIIRAIAGLDGLSKGEIFFDDRRIDALAPKDRDVALLNHDYTPYPGLSVFDNLAVGLRRRSFAETEIKKRISAVADALGLETQLEANAKSLSAGQRQCVGLARAMVRQPKVYLFDEPFAGLEPGAARRGRGEIVKLHQRSSATIVYATSLPTEALAFGERTVVITDGAIQQDDLAQNIYDAPANLTVARCFGDPVMNLVTGRLKEERSGLVFSEAGDGTIAIQLPPDRFAGAKEFLSRPVVLGFWPEAIEIGGPIASGKDGGESFRALVERAEQRGSGTDLYLQTGAHALIARSLSPVPEQAGQRVQFRVGFERAHLFDAESGRRVTPQP
jgi:multiple sugar transport system ATP-binding protein